MMGLLNGIRIVDLTHQVAGPFCTQLLADLGADVIKIEPPGRGDGARDWPELGPSVFLALNRNKRSLALNLLDERGRSILHRLVAKADVLVENFAPEAKGKLQLTYEALKAVNSRLIYCSIAGYHSRSPYADQAAWDPVIQAQSGLMSVTGEPQGAPVRIGASLVDMGAALYAATAVLAALYERMSSGEGRQIEVPLLDCAVSFMSYWLVFYSLTARIPERTGSGWPAFAPYRAFQAQDGYVFIAASNDAFWHRLCSALEWEDLLADPRFATGAQRVAHREALDMTVAERVRQHPVAPLVARLSTAGVPCAPLNSVADLAGEPDLRTRGLIRPLRLQDGREVLTTAAPLYFGDDLMPRWQAPPTLGEHTDGVLREIGCNETELRELRAAGVINTT